MSDTKSPNQYDREIGERIRAVRKDRKMSQETLGQRVGLTFQQVQKYEKGVNRISAGRLIEVATVLNVSAEELIKGLQPPLKDQAPSFANQITTRQAEDIAKGFSHLFEALKPALPKHALTLSYAPNGLTVEASA